MLNNPLRFVDFNGLQTKDSITLKIEAYAGQGNVSGLQNLLNAGGLNPSQTAPARSLYQRANQINHIFNQSKHKLDVVVKACGNKGNALDDLLGAYSKAAKGRSDGFFETIVNVGGHNVTVRGAVVGGTAKERWPRIFEQADN